MTKNKTFLFTFLAITIISTLLLFFGDKYYFYFHQDNLDSFMDLFNSIIAESHNSSAQGIYPPLAVLPYRILSHLVPGFIDTSLPGRAQAFQLRASLSGTFILLLHIMLFIIPLSLMIYNKIKGSTLQKTVYTCALVFSGIMLWCLERGNIIIYAFLFTFIFLLLHDSKSKVLQNVAYLSLAIAASLKLYPAIFGLVLIQKKDWKGCIICFADFIILYLVSFFACNYRPQEITAGIENVSKWANNIASEPVGLNCSIKNFFMIVNGFLFRYTNHAFPKISSSLFFKLLQGTVLICGIFSFFFSKEFWKKLACLSLLCVYIPSTSFQYAMVFLLIPLVGFLNTNESNKFFDNLYAVIFAILISMIIIPIKIPASIYFISGGFIVQQCSMCALAILLFYESIKNLVLSEQRK